MHVKRAGLVLGKDVDLTNAGIEAITQRKIDEPELSSEGNGSLGTFSSQGLQSLPCSSGHYYSCQFLHRHSPS